MIFPSLTASFGSLSLSPSPGHSYVDGDGKQLVASSDMDNTVELGIGGAELIITRRSEKGISTKSIGSREYLRYYRQKPCPSPMNNAAITAALASRSALDPITSAILSVQKHNAFSSAAKSKRNEIIWCLCNCMLISGTGAWDWLLCSQESRW